MGGAAPSSFRTVVVNSGCSGSCFEFVPDELLHPSCADATTKLVAALASVTWQDLHGDLWRAVPSNQPLIVQANSRLEGLAAVHTHLFAALSALNLKGDKDKQARRVNPFGSVALVVQGHPLVEALCTGGLSLEDTHAVFDAMYVDNASVTDETVDLLLYDLMCARAVFVEPCAYQTLFEHSAFWADGRLKSVEAGQHELVQAIALQADDTALVVMVEAPPCGTIEALFPAAIGWTEWTDDDPLNPLAVRGVGSVTFGGNCTNEFRTVLRPLATVVTWVERMLAVRVTIGSPGLKAVMIAVHWHHSSNLHEYVACIATLLHTAVDTYGADMAIVAGDFNFASTADAIFVQRALAGCRGISAHPTDASGDVLMTTKKQRSPFQTQHKKINVKVEAARIMEFRLTAASVALATAGQVVSGGSPCTPNPSWPFDHGAVVNVTTLPSE